MKLPRNRTFKPPLPGRLRRALLREARRQPGVLELGVREVRRAERVAEAELVQRVLDDAARRLRSLTPVRIFCSRPP